jgi:hypothetical protein
MNGKCHDGENSTSTVCSVGLVRDARWRRNLLAPDSRYLLQSESTELFLGVQVDILGGFELDLQRRSAPGTFHQEAHDGETQPGVLGNQLPVTGPFGIGSAKRQQTAFVDGTAGPRPRAAVGTSRSCLEPTLARTFSHPTKESESIDFDPGFPYRGCPGALLPNELVGKFPRGEASRLHAELGDACLHFRYFEPFIHSRIELSDDRFRGSSRSKQAEPNVSRHSGNSAFRHCRHVWKLWPSRLAGHGHRSQPSIFDERKEHRF